MAVTLAGGAVTEEGARDPVLAAVFRCPRQADRVQQLRPDRDCLRRHREFLGDLVASLVPHPVQQDVFHRQAAPEQAGVLAVAGNHPVVGSQDVGGAERCRLLAAVLRVRAHPPRSLQLERHLVEMAADRHVLVETNDVRLGDEITAELFVEVPMLVQDGDMLDGRGEDGLNRHARAPCRQSCPRRFGGWRRTPWPHTWTAATPPPRISGSM